METVLVCILLVWVGVGILSAWSYRGTLRLREDREAEPLPSTPRVSIIVAARNEEKTLPAALESFFNLDYPDYEVIVVNDDSTDQTGWIAEEWARRPESRGQLKVIHNHELPRGWTGKVHALDLATRAARGDWILATDADVVFHPALLRLALGCAHSLRVALLSLVPEFELGSFADKVVLPAFSLLLTTLYPLRLVNRPRFPRALAAGAFILMRRADLEALGGYGRLRQTVIEDLRMAELFKHHGRRIYLAMTRGLFRTRSYRTWRGLWEGLGRSAFEGAGFSVARILGGVVFGNLVSLLPGVLVVARLLGDARAGRSLTDDPTLLLAIGTSVVSALVSLPFVLYTRASPLYALAIPFASVFYSAVSITSAWKSLIGEGVVWKDRRYRKSSP